MLSANRWVIVALIIAGLILSACGRTSDTSSQGEPAEVERIEGSDLSRVILSAKAAERLGIQTAPVRIEEVERKWMIGAEVVAAPIGGRTPPIEDPSAVWVRVALSEGELIRIDRGKPARVLAIAGDDGGPGATAQPVEALAADDPEEASSVVYYAVDDADHGLVPGQRVRVELVLSGSVRTIIPYASLIYDLNGDTWTYTNPEPLVFLRHPVTVDYIDADLAILSDGPPADVAVVTIGAAELFGVELGVE